MPTKPERLTLFKALMLVGFTKAGPGRLERGRCHVKFKMGYEPHWWINTPLGTKEYESQGQTLHALTLYRLVTRQDLEKMSEFGFAQARKEILDYDKTTERAVKVSRSLDREKHRAVGVPY